jgi:hypothetical protein
VRLEGLGKFKKSTSSGIRTGDLPTCSIVPQPTTLPRAPYKILRTHYLFRYVSPLSSWRAQLLSVVYNFILFITYFSCDSTAQFLGLSHHQETFRFISVIRSRTVGRTPWMGDQFVARPLLTAPDDYDDGEVSGMYGFGRGNRSTRRKPAPTPLCPP